MPTTDLKPVFDHMRGILKSLAKGLVVVHDTDDHFYVDSSKVAPNGKPMFFAAARVAKDKVSVHLMPVYTAPALLVNISPALKKRMQGKSCFNFSAAHLEDKALLKEFAALGKAALAQFKKDGWV